MALRSEREARRRNGYLLSNGLLGGNPMSHPIDRFSDLQKQGFMKPLKVRRPKVERPIVACHDCLNWHQQGKHSADAETRKANQALWCRFASKLRSNG
jgi:hypothetical protein